ncbi:Hypothetical predicted protein, partial [Scomber scombrus]
MARALEEPLPASSEQASSPRRWPVSGRGGGGVGGGVCGGVVGGGGGTCRRSGARGL